MQVRWPKFLVPLVGLFTNTANSRRQIDLPRRRISCLSNDRMVLYVQTELPAKPSNRESSWG